MKITINNQHYFFDHAPSVQTLMQHVFSQGGQNGMAVAVNHLVIPKKDWQHHTVNEGDHVILIRATQGG